MAHRFILASAATLYLALSLVCVFAPSVLPSSILGSSVVGPPMLLVWGRGIWSLYAVVTLALAALVVVAVKSRTPELRIMSGYVAAALWAASGFFSVALSLSV